MYTGKTLFAQLMDFLPWTSFGRIVQRYGGDRHVKSLRCAEHFRAMAFCPADLPGESQGHRSLSVGAGREALSHGVSRTDSSLDTVRCERSQRLAHLRRLRAGADPSGQKALRGREPRGGTLGNSLRARFDDNRPLPVGLPLGAVPFDQGSREDAYAARSAGAIPSFIHISDGKVEAFACNRP